MEISDRKMSVLNVFLNLLSKFEFGTSNCFKNNKIIFLFLNVIIFMFVLIETI